MITVAKSRLQCAGVNRHEAEDERALRERSSDPLGPESCAATARDTAKRRQGIGYSKELLRAPSRLVGSFVTDCGWITGKTRNNRSGDVLTLNTVPLRRTGGSGGDTNLRPPTVRAIYHLHITPTL